MHDGDATAPRRVLVTGASGFLGGYVVADLRAAGIEVFATGRNSEALARIADEDHRIVADLSALAELDLAVDAVIHCAALSTPWGAWRDFERANVTGTAHVAAFMKRNSVTRLVHISSPSVYAGPRDRLNIQESDVDESNRLNGYIRSKIAAEALLAATQASGATPEVVILRPRGLLGIGDPSLVPRLLDVHARIGIPLIGGGEQLIDVTAVENVALAARLALTRGNTRCGVYNITNGEPRSFRDLLDHLIAELGRSVKYRRLGRRTAYALASVLEGVCAVLPGRPEPPLTRYTLTTIAYAQTLDISKAERELGYRPTVSLDDAVRAVAAHLREEAA